MAIEKNQKMDKSKSFINPFDVEFTEENVESDDDHSSDPDYEPSFNITISEDNVLIAEEENEEDGLNEEEDLSDQPELDLGPGVFRVKNAEDIQSFVDDNPFIVYSNQLVALAKTSIKVCNAKGCSLDLRINTETIASAVYLKWVCLDGHVAHTWCSHPVLNRRLHGGDLMFATAVLSSGSNFQKVQMFANILKLPILSRCTYFRIQRTYLIPCIDDFLIDQQNDVINTFQGQDLVILGDGRMDSPGHCAQYCSYTFMENKMKKILCIITMDKRVTEKKSTNLEKACFIKGLKFLLDKDLKIKEIVTDAHVQVAAYMKKEQPNIKHFFDIWHGTKNLGKRIVKLGNEKDKRELLDWTKDIVNHYWYTAQISNTKDEFLGNWIGILHHVTNEHECYTETNGCNHGPLLTEREKGWLKKNSPPHLALRSIVFDKRLINNIPYYVNCRSTAELENFQSLSLMYASKRHSYRPPTYRCRNLLAALDHNGHNERPMCTNKDGTVRYQRIFQKKSSRWSAFPVKAPKTYSYIPDLVKSIVVRRVEDNVGMSQPFELERDDPRRISAHLAPLPPPSTLQIVSEQISRFSNARSSQSVCDLDRTVDYDWQN